MRESNYDIIICGAGLAGLSLLYKAMKSGIWVAEEILVVDKSSKTANDKTWSFWKEEAASQHIPGAKNAHHHAAGQGIPAEDVFAEISSHQWDQLTFFSADGKEFPLDAGNYSYNSIRSIDFYHHVLQYLQQFKNITFVAEEIVDFSSSGSGCRLITNKNSYTSAYLFNSVYRLPELAAGTQYFLQHFKGWRIRTDSAILPLSQAYLMDFRTGQEQGTSFFYCLPMAANELFVEYTLFTKILLTPEAYDRKIESYLREILKIGQYTLLEEEFGIIPMTDHSFRRFEGNIVHLGTAGGDTRASTGYTFTYVQKTTDQILESFRQHKHPFFSKESISIRHQLYDTTLLNVLAKSNYQGHQLFTDLFSKSKAASIFAFLDAESTIFQDMQVMKSLRIMPFLRAFLMAVYKRFINRR